MGDSPLGWCDGEASASGRLRWPATSTGSSCSTRPTRGRGEGEVHGWAAEEGWAVLTWEVESAVALGLDFMAARCPRRLAPDKE
jgi:hypothetical protein